MGIIADRLAAQIERLQELDRRQQESIEKLLSETRKILADYEPLAIDEK
jgi:hypothetical protein